MVKSQNIFSLSLSTPPSRIILTGPRVPDFSGRQGISPKRQLLADLTDSPPMGLGPELAASVAATTPDTTLAPVDKVGLNRLKRELDAKLDAKLAQHKRRQAARDRVASATELHTDDAGGKLSSVTRTAFMVVLHRRQLKVYLAEKSTEPLLVVEAAEEMHGEYFVGFTAATGTRMTMICVVLSFL